MEIKTITEEYIRRADAELKFNSKLYKKEGEPFCSQALSSMAGCSLPAVDLWHGLWYQGEMACLFGEPNVGKTILAMQIANELNKRGLKTLYFDFENAAHQFKSRYKTDKFDYCSGDADFIVKLLNPNNSTAPLDSRSILDYIKKDFLTERAPVIIIDDITHLIGSGDQADVRFVLNTLRSWTQLFLVSILVLAHSRRRKPSSLTTIESLAGSFEYSYAFDSIFSLTHSNGFLQFNDLYTGGNERQLLRYYGYDTTQQIKDAILHYHSLCFSTREIADIVGCSQSHVSKTLNKHKKDNVGTRPVSSDNNENNLINKDDITAWLPQPMPKVKLEPEHTPIYDPSNYVIDPYGERITLAEYNEYYSEASQDEDTTTMISALRTLYTMSLMITNPTSKDSTSKSLRGLAIPLIPLIPVISPI